MKAELDLSKVVFEKNCPKPINNRETFKLTPSNGTTNLNTRSFN